MSPNLDMLPEPQFGNSCLGPAEPGKPSVLSISPIPGGPRAAAKFAAARRTEGAGTNDVWYLDPQVECDVVSPGDVGLCVSFGSGHLF